MVDSCLGAFVAAIDPLPLDQTRCGAGKKKCISKKVSGLLKCHGSAQTPGKPADPNAKGCIDKVEAKFDGGTEPAKGCFEKLENATPNDCLTVDDTAALAALVDDCAAELLAGLTPTPTSTTTTTTTSSTTTTTTSTSTSTTTTTTTSTTTTTTCPAGFADCDLDPSNGCEADLNNDPFNCGLCGSDCAGGVCVGGVCQTTSTTTTTTTTSSTTTTTCPPGLVDCDLDPSNGCEADGIHIPVRVECVGSGQHCDAGLIAGVIPEGSPLFMTFTVGDEQCASFRFEELFYNDVARVPPPDFLGWRGAPPPFDQLPLSIAIELGTAIVGDLNTVGLDVEGQTGGCDEGRLPFWEGTLAFCW